MKLFSLKIEYSYFRAVIQIQGMYNFDRAYQNFDITKFSQEELEFFSLKCTKQLLLAISMFQYANTNQKKELGFSSKELGRLGEYTSQLILGVNLIGGFENFKGILEEFLMLIFDMKVDSTKSTVRNDFKKAIALELRTMNANGINKDKNRYYI